MKNAEKFDKFKTGFPEYKEYLKEKNSEVIL